MTEDNNNNGEVTPEKVVPFKVVSNDNPRPIHREPANTPVDPIRDVSITLLDGTLLEKEGFLGVYPDFLAVGKEGNIDLVVPLGNVMWAQAVNKTVDGEAETTT